MLSTSNLQLQKKTFCQAQTCLHKNGINILAVDITIDHLNLAFTTKSIWNQGHILFQQSTLGTARVPYSQWETDESPGDSRVQLCSVTNVLTQDYDECSFFPPVSRKSESMTNSGGNRSQAQRVKLTVFPDAG